MDINHKVYLDLIAIISCHTCQIIQDFQMRRYGLENAHTVSIQVSSVSFSILALLIYLQTLLTQKSQNI